MGPVPMGQGPGPGPMGPGPMGQGPGPGPWARAGLIWAHLVSFWDHFGPIWAHIGSIGPKLCQKLLKDWPCGDPQEFEAMFAALAVAEQAEQLELEGGSAAGSPASAEKTTSAESTQRPRGGQQ